MLSMDNTPDRDSVFFLQEFYKETFMSLQALTKEDLFRKAPSIFAQEPWEKMSEKYRFFPTIDVVDGLMKNGFVPFSARQSNTRIEGKENFTRHVIRFRHSDMMKSFDTHITGEHRFLKSGPEIPEIILMNSHDGTSSYKLMLGIFRLVCANGLIVKSGDVREVSVRHSGRESLIDDVIEGSYEIIDEAPVVMNQIEEWKSTVASIGQQQAFANAALELRGTSLDVSPISLLSSRRSDDSCDLNGKRDIWKTMNVVQENLIRGGVQGRRSNGDRQRLRSVKSVDVDTKLNRALWVLTDHFNAQVKAAV